MEKIEISADEFRAMAAKIAAEQEQHTRAGALPPLEPERLALERERLKLERERLAVEAAREKLRREQSRDRIAPATRQTVDPGGVVAAIMSAFGALVAIIGALVMIG